MCLADSPLDGIFHVETSSHLENLAFVNCQIQFWFLLVLVIGTYTLSYLVSESAISKWNACVLPLCCELLPKRLRVTELGLFTCRLKWQPTVAESLEKNMDFFTVTLVKVPCPKSGRLPRMGAFLCYPVLRMIFPYKVVS